LHRLSHSNAELLFKTTYYDPFNPDLHMHTIKPDLLRHSLTTSSFTPTLSVASVQDTIRRDGWANAAQEVRFNATALILDWQRAAWERWGTPSGNVASSWPPT
jgi:serine/arginine repetitive matrix protein 2